jgi:hypothetical protein
MQQIRELYDELESAKSNVNGTTHAEKSKTARSGIHNLQPEELIIQQKLLPNEHLLLGDFTERQLTQNAVPVVERKNPPAEKAAPASQVAATVTANTITPEKTTSINESILHPGSLNEKLKTTSGKEVHKRLASKPLKDLIDLNHRFILLNELFKGNAEAFSGTVNHIDSLNDFNAAWSFIQDEFVATQHWDANAHSTIMFVKLVKQKFGLE